jgi:glycosyltransferase involved in cell wall biosynthesis
MNPISQSTTGDSLVSVITPTYNRAYCLGATIESVLAQTYTKWELIILDDGSNDNTGDLVRREFCHDHRIHYFYQRNMGVSGARNKAMQMARGEFIAFLDADDQWEPWKLEMQVAVLKRLTEVGMVWTDMKAVDKEGALISANYLRIMYDAYRYFPTSDSLFGKSMSLGEIAPRLAPLAPGKRIFFGDIYAQMLMGNMVHTSTVMLRHSLRQKVGFFREEMRAGEDFEFHLRTCREGAVAFVDVSSTHYQVGRPDQLTVSRRKDLAINFLKTVEPILSQDEAQHWLPPHLISERLSSAYAWMGDRLLDEGDIAGAREALKTSLRHRLNQPRPLFFLLLYSLPFDLGNRLRRFYRIAKRAIARLRSSYLFRSRP